MLSKNRTREIQSLQLKKHRDARRLFIAEGATTVAEAVTFFPGIIEEIFCTDEFARANPAIATQKHTIISGQELSSISLQQSPNGALAVCRYREAKDTFDAASGFSLFLDEIRDPGNLGTIIRLADWFGLGTIFCSPGTCDIYNPKVVQSSMGAFMRVNVIYDALENVIRLHNVSQVYGGVLNGSDIYREKVGAGLLVIGNEANGISAANLALVNRPLTIPSAGTGGESLNAAMAAAILASEFFRTLRAQ